MSSGVALMVAATPANAAQVHKSYVCKYVNKPGGGSELVQTGQNPIWVDNHSIAGKDVVSVGDKFTDEQGYSVVIVANTAKLNPEPGLDACTGTPPPPLDQATATVSFTDPTCEAPSSGSITKSADEASFVVTPDQASYSIGDSVTVTATADSGAAFDEGATTTWNHTFEPSDGPCVEGPRVLTPQEPSFTDPTCTTDPSVTLPSAPVLSRAAAGSLPDSVDVNGIRYTATGDLVPGGTVTVDATLLDEGTTFGDAKHSWSHTFTTPTGCTQVSPPVTESQVVVNTPKTKSTKTKSTVTPTVVEAGLVGTSAQDLRGEQGLALMVAGMVMLVAAGGLGLRVRSAAARN
jgi:hypothetical protein